MRHAQGSRGEGAEEQRSRGEGAEEQRRGSRGGGTRREQGRLERRRHVAPAAPEERLLRA
eukprot:694351-Rhodomonas_salina.1